MQQHVFEACNCRTSRRYQQHCGVYVGEGKCWQAEAHPIHKNAKGAPAPESLDKPESPPQQQAA